MPEFSLGIAELGTAVDLSGLEKGIGNAETVSRNGFRSISTQLSTVLGGGLLAVASGTTALAAGLTAISISGFQMAADLEQQMANIQAAMGASADEMAQLNDLVLQLGVDPNLKVSAEEAAAAIEMLGRNGLRTQEILDGAAHATVLLSNSTGADFGTAANIATDAMALWNIEAENMIEAVNGITAVTVASKFGIEDYALALAQGGGVASAVGVSFEDFNSTIAAISPLFASGSDAGTSFKTFLTSLIPKSKDAEEAMRELGIITAEGQNSFFDASGQLKSMAEIVGILNEATKDLSEEQKNQYFSTIFGTDAMRAAFGVASMTEEQFRELQATMGKTDAVESAATRMDTVRGALEILGGVIDTIKIQIGQAFIPLVRDLAEKLTSFFSRNQKKIEAFFKKFAAFVGEAIDWIIALVKTIASGFSTAKQIFENIRDTLQSVFRDGESSASSAWARIQSVVSSVLGIIQGLIMAFGTAVGSFLRSHGDEIKAFFSSTWQTISEIVDTAMAIIQETIIPAWQEVVSFIQAHTEEIAKIIGGAWDIITNVIGVALALIKGTLQTVLALIRGDWDGAWNSIKETASTIWGHIKGVVTGAVTVIQTTLSLVWAAIGRHVLAVWGAISTFFSDWWETIKRGFSSAVGAVESTLESAWETIKGAVETTWNGIRDFISGIWRSIVDGIKSNINTIIDGINLLIDGLNAVNPFEDIPHVPHLAQGTDFFQGGLAVVGERGRELVMLPRGSKVLPNRETERVLGGVESGGNRVVNIYNPVVDSPERLDQLRQLILSVLDDQVDDLYAAGVVP